MINLTHGAIVTATAGAADVGSAVDTVVVTVDRMLQTDGGPTNMLTFSSANDDFSDGLSSISRMLTSDNTVGHVGIVSISVTDNTRVAVTYSNSNLAQFRLQNGFDLTKNAQHTDFTGDGHSDILFQNANGSVSTWTLAGTPNSTSVTQSAFNADVNASWHATDSLDLNGDGLADILYRNDNGALAAWTSTGSGFNQAAYYHAPIGNDWRVAGTGDLNGDGKEDLMWQNANGSISAWRSTGTGFVENIYSHASPGGGWQVEGLGDFNGDGKADILWRNSNGAVAMWTNNGTGTSSNESAFLQPGVSTSCHVTGVGDFTGDGRDDILWRNDDGSVTLWRSNGSGFDQSVYNTSVDPSWHVASVGDFNDDGRADILWRNDNGSVSTWQSNGNGFDQSVYNSATTTDWHVVGHSYVL